MRLISGEIMEKWDILSPQGRVTGKTVVRGHALLKPGEYHLVVHIWIVSSTGKFLIQQRSLGKKLMPGEWAATGGAAVSGEDSFTAAQRELYEELGIKSDETTLKFKKRFRRRNSFVDVWFITTDITCDRLRLQKSEVAAARWVSEAELEKMIRDGNFHNYGKEYFATIFDVAKELCYELKG